MPLRGRMSDGDLVIEEVEVAEPTPGPWRFEVGPQGGYVISADAVICQRAPWPHRAAESKANAALIASAPELKAQRDELLAALQSVVDAWEGKSGMGTLNEMPRALSRARAAIARATGEQS